MIVRMPRRNQFGILMGCAPFQLALDRLNSALKYAASVGVPKNNPVRMAAQSFFDKYDATLAFYYIYDQKACETITLETEGHLAALGKQIDAITGPGVAIDITGTTPGTPRPDLSKRPGDESSPFMSFLGEVKWIVLGAGVIAAAYLAGPAIRGALRARAVSQRRNARRVPSEG